ncbi:E3 ubiquitin-protein ligase CHFR-like isoform X2 [Ostrea edulis]|nr:E3 ubiquitin-protein ligase CHFR-like isoform X2 [Ostrea edulis]XP_056004867.1 E3 ubiquitin-protein ligase CHFR-like isoform X2 [Ostrea edulis]
MEELRREEDDEGTQEYSTDILEATLADADVNEVEATEKSPDSRKRPAESTSPTEPVKKLKRETKEDSDDCKKKTDVKKSAESAQSDQQKSDTETKGIKGDKVPAAEPKKDEIEEALVCIICQEIMHDCVSLQPCMHTFCAGCYSDWMKRSPECPSCRMGVDRINKNHIVNNLIEAYLKEHPGKKRPEEEIKELDAKNKISRDMLYPADLKDREYDPDESVNDSDDYEEDEDEADNSSSNPVVFTPLNTVVPTYGGGLFGNWNQFVCRQCPNYRDPNAANAGVIGTVVNTVRTALGLGQNNPTVPTTDSNQAGPSGAQSTTNQTEVTSDDSQSTLPTMSTADVTDDFEERKKKDDIKPDIAPFQYVCIINQNHILCQCCLLPMPDRRAATGLLQQCSLCLRAYCHAYWGCRKAECLGCIGKFKDLVFGRKCLLNLILDNTYESEILKNYLEEKKMTLNEMRDVCMQKLDAGTYRCTDQIRLQVTSDSTVCYPCALRNFKDLAYAFRADIKKEDLPEAVRRRADCYWGKNCRTQRNKPHHAQNFSHICEQTRTM